MAARLVHDLLQQDHLMPAMISYSIAVTPVNGAATSVTITPPPAYVAGNLLVMTVTGGGTAGTAVSASTPSGWTALSSSGAGLSVFYKTATSSEPGTYTVTMAATCSIAAYIAAYPAATIASHSFGNSGSGTVSYTGTWPSASSSQLVLVPAGAVASGGNAGYQNVVYPSGLTTEVPVFGQALPDDTSSVYPCAIGLYDVTGSVMSGLPAPEFTSPQVCTVYAGFIVLTLTGTSSPYTVTAAVAYPEGTPGLLLTVKALSGAASASDIYNNGAFNYVYGNGTSQAPAVAVTPAASGSLVYGAVVENYSVAGSSAFTPASGTVFTQNVIDTANELIYGTFEGASVTTAGSTVTLGGSAPDNAYFTAVAAEIMAAPGSTLSETATATAAASPPGDFASTAVEQTAVFTAQPAEGTLLVAMVAANSRWTQRQRQSSRSRTRWG